MSTENVLLGVTGGIAAYKAPELVRRLAERGARVQVVTTHSALEFVTATALQAVSGRPVRTTLWDRDAEAAMGHIELARWADRILVAPATAEFLSRLALGSAPDLLATLCLASEAPVYVAPAMNRVMWAHPAVQANVDTLAGRGVHILGPGIGEQACGEVGLGRMSEPDELAAAVLAPPAGTTGGTLAGTRVLITAGPTREAIDPVRYISNRSSGKMGYALAAAARDAGADVLLVSGPVSLEAPAGVRVLAVESAEELYRTTLERIDAVDIFIGAAAVSDYRPEKTEPHKIKKSAQTMKLGLTRAPDTLAAVAAREHPPFTVGFAAETDRTREYALAKLQQKKLDMIVANRVGKHEGFDRDDNAAEAYWHGGEQAFPLAPKTALAAALIDLIAAHYRQRSAGGGRPGVAALAAQD